MLARLLALPQIPHRGFQFIALGMQLAESQVQVCYSGQRRIAVLQGELQRSLVDPAGLGETTARLRKVGRVIGRTGGGRDVAGFPQAGAAFGMGLLGRLEIAARPLRQREKRRCPAPPDVVTLGQEVQRAARVLYGARQIAERLGAKGSGEGDRPRQRPELRLVRDHHMGRFAPRSLEPQFGIPQPGRRVVHLTHAQEGEGVVRAENGPCTDEVVRYQLEPFEEPRRLVALPDRGSRDEFDQARHSLEITGGKSGVDRFGWLTVPREPLARTLVQGKYLVWLL